MVHVRDNVKEVQRGVLIEKQIEKEYRDISLKTDVHYYGKIDRVFLGHQIPGNPNRICKVRFRKSRRPEFGDKHCLTPDHEVMTSNGWKFINTLTTNDEVYTLRQDGSFGYENPVKLYEVECDNAELYNLESQQVDLCVTLDHKMWVKKRDKPSYEFVKAKDVYGKRVSYAKSAKNINPDYQLILPAAGNKTPAKAVNMGYFLEFFGYWISDGWARISTRQRPNRKTQTTDYIVEIAQVKPVDRVRLIELIKLLGHTPTLHGASTIQIVNRQLCEFLHPLSVGAPNKYLPEWVWQLSTIQCHQLYEGLRRGDGTVTKNGCDVYYTSSVKLANDVQRLALHAEWSGNIKLRYKAGYKTIIKGQEITSNYDALAVHIIKTKNNPMVNHGHAKTQSGQKESFIKYTGSVYCIEVPSHVFYVRKNGKPVWTGNCSSHGQKGVIGMIIRQENMPFTKDGIVPDLIINPHAFPSRMTMGHVIETIFAKLCCIEGTRGDGTVFMPFDKEAIFNTLEEHGLEKHGNEVLYNGRTGEQIKTEIFIGPIYYYRLKHMVTDKIHSRSTGPKVQLTHQPTSGRSAGGGLRIGEMERDVLLSHGLSQFAKECMMEKSDSYRWGVCRHCGILANYTPRRNIIECLNCGLQDISVIETPYAFKLLIQEMEAMGIQIRLSSEEFPEGEENAATDFMYPELYNYIETAKPKKQPKKKMKKSAAKDTENESEAEQSEADESDEGSDAESELSAAASEMEGGEDGETFKLDTSSNTSNVLSVGIMKDGGEVDLDLDMDGIYGGDTLNPPSILDQLNGEHPLTIVSSSIPDSPESVGSPNTESNIQQSSPQSSPQSSVVIKPPNSGDTNPSSDVKVITINNRNQLPEPKGGASEGDNERDSDDFDGGDDEFFTD
jgi:hypothetical protein